VSAYREAADKPEPTIHELWAKMWCMQRHSNDLQFLKEDTWHPAFDGWFKDNPETKAAIPQAARDELYRRGVAFWTKEQLDAKVQAILDEKKAS